MLAQGAKEYLTGLGSIPGSSGAFQGIFHGWSHSATPFWASVAEDGWMRFYSHGASGSPQIGCRKQTFEPPNVTIEVSSDLPWTPPQMSEHLPPGDKNASDLPRMSDLSTNQIACFKNLLSTIEIIESLNLLDFTSIFYSKNSTKFHWKLRQLAVNEFKTRLISFWNYDLQ